MQKKCSARASKRVAKKRSEDLKEMQSEGCTLKPQRKKYEANRPGDPATQLLKKKKKVASRNSAKQPEGGEKTQYLLTKKKQR